MLHRVTPVDKIASLETENSSIIV